MRLIAYIVFVILLLVAGGPMIGLARDNSCAIKATQGLLGSRGLIMDAQQTFLPESSRCASERCSYFAGLYWWEEGQYELARESFRCHGGSVGRGFLRTFWVGRSYLAEGETEPAIDYWFQEGYPAEYLQQIGRVYYRENKYLESVYWYDLAARIADDDIQIECERAEAYQRAGSIQTILDEHLPYLQRELAAGIDIPLACLYRAGYEAIERGQHDLGLRFWEPILQLDKGSASKVQMLSDSQIAYAHFRAADIWRARGDGDRERAYLERVILWGQEVETWYVSQARERLRDPF